MESLPPLMAPPQRHPTPKSPHAIQALARANAGSAGAALAALSSLAAHHGAAEAAPDRAAAGELRSCVRPRLFFLSSLGAPLNPPHPSSLPPSLIPPYFNAVRTAIARLRSLCAAMGAPAASDRKSVV